VERYERFAGCWILRCWKKKQTKEISKQAKSATSPEYDNAPLEEHIKKLRRTYQEEYVKSLYSPKREYFFAAADGNGGLMVVDRNGKPLDSGRIIGRVLKNDKD
jgi:hypothetical protein